MTERSDLPWIDKYRPENYSDLQGNNAATDRLKDWARSFPDDTTPRLLIGEPGTGKTSMVEVIADDLGLELAEINASSARKSDDISDMASVISSPSADGERRVVLLDEVDSWHHSSNKKPLYDALDDPYNVVFLTANDEYDTPSAIKSRCETEDFNLGKRSVKAKLKKVADAEGLDISDEALSKLSERPDLRSAITDLQAYGPIADEIPDDSRVWGDSEWDMVDRMMTGTAELGDRGAGEAIMWLDENLSCDWRGLELAWGYEALSIADNLLMRDADIAEAATESIADLRLTEPYYEDQIGGRKKSFPNWFRHRKPKATSEGSEERLYRALSNFEEGKPGLGANFSGFLGVVLPVLQDLPDSEKHELIQRERLDPDEYEALDITESQHNDWLTESEPTEGDGLSRTESAADW